MKSLKNILLTSIVILSLSKGEQCYGQTTPGHSELVYTERAEAKGVIGVRV